MTGERLPPDHSEDADEGRHDGDGTAHHEADLHRSAGKETGFEEGRHLVLPNPSPRAVRGSRPTSGRGPARDHQEPSAGSDDLDGVTVQVREDLGLDDVVGRAAGGPPAGQVHQPVHEGKQRIHVVGGQQHSDLLLHDDLASSSMTS